MARIQRDQESDIVPFVDAELPLLESNCLK
jgi:hypothetical protein